MLDTTKMTRRVQVFIGPAASRALDEIAEETGSITAAVETALLALYRDWETGIPELSDVDTRSLATSLDTETVTSSFNDPARAQRKVDRAARKAKLAEGIAAVMSSSAGLAALSEDAMKARQSKDAAGMANASDLRDDPTSIVERIAQKVEQVRVHQCSGALPLAGCANCAGLAKAMRAK